MGPSPTLPPPPTAPARRTKRPAWALVAGIGVVLRVADDQLWRVAVALWGPAGMLLVPVLALGLPLTYAAVNRRRADRRGGELTAEEVAAQVRDSGLAPPAFEEGPTPLDASVIVVNQRAKVLEVVTEFDLFGWDGRPLGTVRQVGQSFGKHVARILTTFDQFFTHRFEVVDAHGQRLLVLTRPRKFFLSKVLVDNAWGRRVGAIRQRNVFGRIRFELVDAFDRPVGRLQADGLKAWDFTIADLHGRPVGEVVKSWEGWGRAFLTKADRYVVRIGEPLPSPLRELAVVAGIAVDVALKQDARGLG